MLLPKKNKKLYDKNLGRHTSLQTRNKKEADLNRKPQNTMLTAIATHPWRVATKSAKMSVNNWRLFHADIQIHLSIRIQQILPRPSTQLTRIHITKGLRCTGSLLFAFIQPLSGLWIDQKDFF